MEHSSHAHPPRVLSDGRSKTNIGSSQSPCTITSPAASNWTTPSTQDVLSKQARRLQLRNVGFRASALPGRRISPLFGVVAGNDPCFRSINKENSPSNAEKRSTYGEDMPPSPVNILQELQNSTRRKMLSPRPGIGGIFQDSPLPGNIDHNDETSWYNETSNNCSPVVVTRSSGTQKLRELSGNQRPLLSTPPSKYVKSRRVSRVKPRSASSEIAQHIDYLEKELALAKAKNEFEATPAAKKKRSSMRAISVENNNLRHELEELYKKDATTREESERRLEAEAEMKDRLEALEAESEMKDRRIGDLEWELECMRVKVRDAEGLEDINRDLEKRLDALTNLLVQPSTGVGTQSAVASPHKSETSKRISRPQSIFSIAPPSPRRARLSLATVSETALWQTQPLGFPLRRFASESDSEQPFASPECLYSPSTSDAVRSPDATEHSDTPGFFDQRSRASTGLRSVPSSASRPTSFISSSSFGGGPWGIPILPEDDETKVNNKKRRMRRFASGSKSLKPLVLPVASSIQALPVSAPIYPSIETTAGRGSSDISMDPTKSFISRLASSSAIDTPTERPRRPSARGSAQTEALRALEGNRFVVEYSPHAEESPRSQSSEPSPKSSKDQDVSRCCDQPQSRPRSLQKELEAAESEQAGADVSFEEDEAHLDKCLISITRDATPEVGKVIIGVEPPSSKESVCTKREERKTCAPNESPTPSSSSPSPHHHYISTKSPASSSLNPAQAHGMFSRLTSLITLSRRDPVDLAKSLLSNAWSKSSNSLLGGVGWWLIGLIYHHHRWKRKNADVVAVDAPHNAQQARLLQQGDCEQGFQWPRFSAEASRRRVAERCFRDYGATWAPPSKGKQREDPPFLPTTTTTMEGHERPRFFPCKDCTEPSSRRTLRLWFHFSLTIVLAVGMALRHGPGVLLAELPGTDACSDEGWGTRRERSGMDGDARRDFSGLSERTQDSGYASIVFAETLGVGDFEQGAAAAG